MAFTFSQTGGTSGITTITISATSRQELTYLVSNYTLANATNHSMLMAIAQKAYEPTEKYFTITPSAITMDASAHKGTIHIESNDDWVIVSNGWIQLSRNVIEAVDDDTARKSSEIPFYPDERYNVLSGNGNTIVGYSCGENTGDTRNGFISGHCLSSGATAVTATTTVSQTGSYIKPYLRLDSYGADVPYNEETYTINVYSNVDWYVLTDARWIELGTLSGSSNGSVAFTISENTSGFQRNGYISVYNKDYALESLFIVEQYAVEEKPYIILSPESFTVVSSGSTGNTISVSANCSYKIDADVNWIVPSVTGGTGNTIVTFNTNGSVIKASTMGNIIFYNDDLSRYVSVEREAVPLYLSANTNECNFELNVSGSSAISVYSNVDWGVALNQGTGNYNTQWLFCNKWSGSGDDEITITVRGADTPRTGQVGLYDKATHNLTYYIEISVLPNENNVIYYTTSDGQIVTPYVENPTNANLVSNEYINGQGIMTFDGTLYNINQNAFRVCRTLTSVYLPNTITTIGANGFLLCESLSSVTLPNSLMYIYDEAFYECSGLTSINLPNTLKDIRYNAFGGCSNLETVNLSNSAQLETIDLGAFRHCGSLSSITIPSTVIDIGMQTFGHDSGLTTIYCYPTTRPSTYPYSYNQYPTEYSPFWNISSTGTFHYPHGSDYSVYQSDPYLSNWTFIDDL